MESDSRRLILGLDIGANSIGWALFEPDPTYDASLEPGKLVRDERGPALGAHVFEAGVDNYFDTGQGKEESRNAKRRLMRAQRRMTQRRARRQAKCYNLLVSAGLMPEPSSEFEDYREARDAAIKELDRRLSEGMQTEDYSRLPYYLRARALDDPLEPYQLGRALYHLAQRRGFLSNRKDADTEKDEDLGKVKGQIAEIDAEIDPASSNGKPRTLGEYLLRLNSPERRARGRYTSRKLYKDEFNLILDRQIELHRSHPSGDPRTLAALESTVTVPAREVERDEHGNVVKRIQKKKEVPIREELYKAIFYQRPLKSQAHLIGPCDIFDGVRHKPARRRAPMHLLCVQRFRYLQKVNDLLIVAKDEDPRPLTGDEREKLIHVLERNKSYTFAKAKKLLNLPARTTKFNLEAAKEEKGFTGNRTTADLIEVFGENRWFDFSEADRNRIVEDLYSILDDDALKKRMVKAWGMTEEQAAAVAKIKLESDYASLSRQAIEALLPLMEQGEPYATVRKELFGEVEDQPVRDMLPPVVEFLPSLRNPVVSRSLTELRRLVNAIIRRYGMPALIRVELAREMKRGAKARHDILKQNSKRNKQREAAAERIKEECGIADPRRSDVEKVLLYEECGGQCPYTGETIAFCDLFSGKVDVEHIIPFSRYLDNSFSNKTLCMADHNRHRKRNNTPFEAYTEDELNRIIRRVEKFKGDRRTVSRKLERFKISSKEELDEKFGGFTQADMRNTAYASRLALDFLGTLYGLQPGGSHRHDSTGVQRIQPVNGGVTAKLREEWDMLSIVGKREDGKKSRDDHRHHAVDAACVAMTSRRTLQILQTAAARAAEKGRRRFGGKHVVKPPYPEFYDQISHAVDEINVSHRVDKRVSGPIHQETIYSVPRNEQGTPDDRGRYTHLRKELHKLSSPDVASIVDRAVRARVELQLDELKKLGKWDGKPFSDQSGKKHPFADPANHPTLPIKSKKSERCGQHIPIHKVRIRIPVGTKAKRKSAGKLSERKAVALTAVGHGVSQRHVQLGSNHHVCIIQGVNRRGEAEWRFELVDTLTAYTRKNSKPPQPVVSRDVGSDEEFVCSLCLGDAFEYELEPGTHELFRVRGLNKTSIEFVRNRDARKKKDIKKAKEWFKRSASSLYAGGFEKVIITPLGDVRPVHD